MACKRKQEASRSHTGRHKNQPTLSIYLAPTRTPLDHKSSLGTEINFNIGSLPLNHHFSLFKFLTWSPFDYFSCERKQIHCRVSTGSATASCRTLSFCGPEEIPPDKHDYSVLFPYKRCSLSSPHLTILHHPHSDQVSYGWTGGSISPWKT